MNKSGELWRLSATDVAAMIRSREVSAVEVAQACLARLDAVNPLINAVVDWRAEEVLARARNLDERIARGEEVGSLAGVSIVTKVNVDFAGYATTNGVKAQKDLIARTSSPVVDALLHADAVPIGRTNTPAYSYRWFTGNQLHGVTRNPHDARLTPGGSSGGSAAAVAAGICHVAHGTDIAGSIRYPAYACGLHGLRPSLGRIAAYNASAGQDRTIGPQLMAMSGPIARTIADLRLAFHAMARPDARDPWWVPAPLEGPALPRRVAMCLKPGGMDTQPEVCDALLDAAARLRDAGWTVEEVADVPTLKEAATINVMLWMGDGYDAQVQAAQREGDPGAIAALAGQAEIAKSVGVRELSAALVRRAGIAREWQLLLEQYPVVMLPVSGELPFPNDLDLQGAEAYQRVWRAQLTMVGLPVTGLPALSVNTGKVGNTPVGVQLVAGRFREDMCLAAGADIEARGSQQSRIAEPIMAP